MVRFSIVAFAQHGEQVRHDQQCCRGREQKAADDGARKRGVLFLAGAADRHRDHPDDHRSRRHQHGTDSGMAGAQRSLEGERDHSCRDEIQVPPFAVALIFGSVSGMTCSLS